ncbi:MAG: LacI family DNA-binding transcriptional regulator [Leifsonia sp.]
MTLHSTQPVTRNDVARYAGVSTAVVSYVVNEGPKRVAPDTAARVRDAIRVLGYRPNAAARALKLGTSEMLGFLTSDGDNPFFTHFAHAVEDAAAERGFAVLLTNSDHDAAKEQRNIRNLASRKVDGLIISSRLSPIDLAYLMDTVVPTVFVNRDSGIEGYDTVGVDFRAAARGGVRHLIEHGHRNIALVMGADEKEGRELGWLDALAEAGLPEGPVMRADFTLAGGYQAGKRLLAGITRPTAIFAGSDLQGIGVLRALHEGGVSVPHDIAVVAFDGSMESEYSWPALTTVKQPVREMAEAAVAKLLDGGSGTSTGHLTFPTELILRRSCGCPGSP